jgi:rhodanese-related sulfurtransferase
LRRHRGRGARFHFTGTRRRRKRLDSKRHTAHDPDVATFAGRRTLEAMLDEARSRIERLEPARAWAAAERGAVVIDIRSERDRERDGIVPGSLHVPRTVLEWRLEPGGAWRNPHAPAIDQQVVLICDHGCSSILAAATLVELGFSHAGDVVGGFQGWRKAGLPVIRAPVQTGESDSPAGMRPPDQIL